MLNIFYGRERIDKEAFIYHQIAESRQRTLVIVPDQYTLEAEKRAFSVLQTEALMEVEIVSLSRLGFKVLAETGGGRRVFIDKYGRHMLLRKSPPSTMNGCRSFGEACASRLLSRWQTISSPR